MKVVTVKVEAPDPSVVEIFVPVNFALDQFKTLIDDHDTEDIICPVFCGMTADETPDYNVYFDYACKRSIGVSNRALYMGEEPIRDKIIQSRIYYIWKDLFDTFQGNSIIQIGIRVTILH